MRTQDNRQYPAVSEHHRLVRGLGWQPSHTRMTDDGPLTVLEVLEYTAYERQQQDGDACR